MSQWTHVAGCIRIDDLFNDTASKIKAQFGITCTFDDGEDALDKCNVPCGSEGSIQYRIEHTGSPYSLSWGLVSIWGDLRDYNDATAIYEWIKKACDGLMIRSCAVKVDVEGGNSYIIHDNEYGGGIVMDTIIAVTP